MPIRLARLIPCAFGAALLPATACAQRNSGPDVAILAVALPHARTLIPAGRILVSAHGAIGGWPVEAAAAQAHMSYGSHESVMECTPSRHYCRARGAYRGIVSFERYERPGPDTAVITLQMVHMPEEFGTFTDVGELLWITRTPNGPWEITRVERVWTGH